MIILFQTITEEQFIIVDTVFDRVTYEDVKLLEPLVIKLRQEEVSLAYPLKKLHVSKRWQNKKAVLFHGYTLVFEIGVIYQKLVKKDKGWSLIMFRLFKVHLSYFYLHFGDDKFIKLFMNLASVIRLG